MARLSAFFLVFLFGATSAVALVSCGGSEDADLLPGTTAEQIESNLTEIEELSDAEDCIGAESAVAEVTAQVEELRGVDSRLKAALEEGTERLSVVVGRCEEETTEEETEPTLETDVETEVEDEEKPDKEKPDKDEGKSSDPEDPSEKEDPEPPAQENGGGEGKGGGGESTPPVVPPAEETPPSGGVGPSVGVE